MNKCWIVTKRKEYFQAIGDYNYCNLSDMILPRKIAYDSETTGLKAHLPGEIFAQQLGTGENNYLIDSETVGPKEVEKYIKDKILVIHNALFDLGWLYKYDIFPWKVRDTMLASQIMNNGLYMVRHNFGAVMTEHLGLNYDKSEQANISVIKLSTKESIEYCFNDVDKLLELESVLNKKLIEGGYVGTYNLHCRWIRAFAYMQQCGVPISVPEWENKIKTDKKLQIEEKKAVEEYIYDNIVPYRDGQLSLFDTDKKILIQITSPKQMLDVFDKFEINTVSSEIDKKTNKPKRSIAEDVISKTKHPFVDVWKKFQSINHDVTTFGETFLPNIYEGRLYTKYRPIMDTARISAGGKDKKGIKATNTLNIPQNEKSRSPFEANPGYQVIICDYDGQFGMVIAV